MTAAKPDAPKRHLVLEVACETVEDAVTAAEAGADRLELCAALDLGGLTPSAGLFAEVQSTGQLPVWVMIRPRAGDFVYSPSDLAVMARDIELFRDASPAGFVFGALNADGKVNADACRRLIDACGEFPAVFHRAFDRTPSVREALDAVIDLGFRRVLTSGREASAAEGAGVIGRLRERADGRVEILPCGKVRAGNIPELLKRTGCDQVHGSFTEVVPVADGAGYRGYGPRMRVSREEVATARAELDRAAQTLSSPS